MRAHRVLGFLLFGGSVWAQQYVISTIAGGAPPTTPGKALAASIGDPTRVATDAAGNVYFGSLHSVFKVDAAGTLTRFAGNGRAGNSGDGGPAAAAQLSFPMGIAIDAAGNVFVADRDASVVRKIAANGTITTVAGSGTPGYMGDGGAAISAQINGPFGIALDSAGSLYIADTTNNVVRKVSPDGTISTVAGTGTPGYLGDGGAARSAWLNGPEGVAVDAAGNLYIADTFNGRIRRVGTDGIITTAAGIGSTGIFSGDGGPAISAAISLPPDVATDRAGNLYIADFGNSRVRMVTNGIITTAAGRNNGVPPIDGEEAVNARLEGPTGLTVDRSGNIYFVESGIGSGTGLALGDYKVWKVSAAGILTTLAGNGIASFSGDGSAATAAQFNGPVGVAVGAVRSCVHLGHAESAGACRGAGRHSRHGGGHGGGGVQWRDRLAARRAAQSSAGGRGGCAGQLVCRGHGEQPRAKSAAGRQPVHHRGQWKRQLLRRWRAGVKSAA